MEKIKNYEIYNYRMKKSLLDKMFFLDKCFEPFENIVDFGCADGELICEMNHLLPDYNYIGYDIDDTMLSIARSKNKECSFYDKWQDMKIDFNKSLLNISSTIHEVYSYGTNESIKDFWNKVYKSGFKYVCIRDMLISESLKENVTESQIEKIKNSKYTNLESFENVWGSIKSKKNFIHYLLKYRYLENWNREVKENYLPITVETLLETIPNNYKIIYIDHYTLPYIAYSINKDFNIEIDEKTHFKLILEKIDDK